MESVASEVLAAAADYESPSLYRYIWGEDNPKYDEDEDYDEDVCRGWCKGMAMDALPSAISDV